jgi:beta-phosphoglucomutase
MDREKRRLRAVIFDLDGVLIDSEIVHARAWEQALRIEGIEMHIDWFKDWFGKDAGAMLDYFTKNFELTCSPNELLNRKRQYYTEQINKKADLYPGTKNAIRELKGFELGIATSSTSDNVRIILKTNKLESSFKVIIGYNEVSNWKPHPEPYLKAARGLGVEPGQCVVIEDTATGITAGKSAGMMVLGVKNTQTEKQLEECDRIFKTTPEAIEWIKNY